MVDDLKYWCAAELQVAVAELGEFTPVAGDASFRRYFRLEPASQPSVVLMDAPPAKEDSRPFLDVAERLRRAGIRAPRIIAQDLSRGWILLEDFGDTLFKEALERAGSHAAVEALFAPVFEVLERQALDVSSENLPAYDASRLQSELDLLPHWYLTVHTGKPFDDREAGLWRELCGQLIHNAAVQPQAFVHRDFHSCNLMMLEDHQLGVIDFQDAVRGPLSYDLMSILLDRYITWPRKQLETWIEAFRVNVAPEVDPQVWLRWCDWMGLQRNLKIIGIFARLAHRDGKNGYLSLIPRFADYVRDVLARYNELRVYRELLEPRL